LVPFIDNILSPVHLLVVLGVALLVLGPKRLPEVGRAIGRGIHDMRSMIDDVKPSREELLGTVEPDAPAGAATAATAADRKA
jgi:TatA/E family protein of Tat protein translocase